MMTVALFRRMKKKNEKKRPVAKEMTQAEIDKVLIKIGRALQARRKSRTSMEAFCYELNISRSQMTGYEQGKDMYLSTFIKLLYGLDVEAGEFWKEV